MKTRSIINRSAVKRIYYGIGEKWEISQRMPRGLMGKLENILIAELIERTNHRGCREKGQQKFNF